MKITIKEASEILGVTTEALKWHIRKLFPEILENGKKTNLTEFQITEIKKNMKPTSELVGSVTDRVFKIQIF